MACTLTRLSSAIAFALLLSLVGLPWPAGAGRALAAGLDAKETARARQARQLYKEGNYEEAAKIYSDLSSDHPDLLVFTRNLGACYYYLRRPEPALSNLREYLQRARNVSPTDRDEVERWIAEMDDLRVHSAPTGPAVAGLPPATAATPSPALPPETATANAPSTPPGVPPAVAFASSPTASRSPGSTLRVTGIACAAVGLASIGTAIYFYTRATSLSDRITSSDAPSASDFKSGKTAETMQWVFYGVGAAALAAGAVLYYIGWHSGSASGNAVAVAPAVGPGFAGLSAQRSF